MGVVRVAHIGPVTGEISSGRHPPILHPAGRGAGWGGVGLPPGGGGGRDQAIAFVLVATTCSRTKPEQQPWHKNRHVFEGCRREVWPDGQAAAVEKMGLNG